LVDDLNGAIEQGAKAEDRVTELQKALSGLVNKLDEVEASPEYKGVWGLYYVHGGKYSGPQYGDERDAAREALNDSDSKATFTIWEDDMGLEDWPDEATAWEQRYHACDIALQDAQSALIQLYPIAAAWDKEWAKEVGEPPNVGATSIIEKALRLCPICLRREHSPARRIEDVCQYDPETAVVKKVL
jgi:hypothetical protein